MHHIPQQLGQQNPALIRASDQSRCKSAPHQVILQACRTGLVPREFQILLKRKRIHLMRDVPAGQLGTHFTPEQARIGTRHTDATSGIEQGAHQALPLRHLLNLIQIDGSLWMGFIQDRLQRGKIFRSQSIQPGIFKMDRHRCAFQRASNLLLKRAFTTAPDTGQHQGVRVHGALPFRLAAAHYFGCRTRQRDGIGQNGLDGFTQQHASCLS